MKVRVLIKSRAEVWTYGWLQYQSSFHYTALYHLWEERVSRSRGFRGPTWPFCYALPWRVETTGSRGNAHQSLYPHFNPQSNYPGPKISLLKHSWEQCNAEYGTAQGLKNGKEPWDGGGRSIAPALSGRADCNTEVPWKVMGLPHDSPWATTFWVPKEVKFTPALQAGIKAYLSMQGDGMYFIYQFISLICSLELFRYMACGFLLVFLTRTPWMLWWD